LAQAQALLQAQVLPQEQFAAQLHATTAGCRQPQVRVSPWQLIQLQETGCWDSFMVRLLRWLEDGMPSMTITFVDRVSWRQPNEMNRRLRSRSGRWHRPNGAPRAWGARFRQ
jgi:hypothetical protein